jgi:hypothetical protein
MANVQITQLPVASSLTGTELVPIVQNGKTVQTTTLSIASTPVLTYPFLTVGRQTGLSNSRYFSTDANLTITDNGAQNSYVISINGALSQLNTLSNGIVAKTGTSTLANISIAVSGSGLSITNGSGVSGNPTISLSGLPSALATATGTGLLALNGSTSISPVSILGTTNQITVTNGDASTGNPTISLSTTGVSSGTYSYPTITIDSLGRITSASNGSPVLSFSSGTTGLVPSSPTTGAIVLSGVLNVLNGGTGTTTSTGTGSVVLNTAPTLGLINATGLPIGGITATGTPSSTTYLRGDSLWSTIPAQVYPSAGIPNSTGSAWGTSYGVTGTGSVVLSTSPTLVTPVLGTPTSATLTNATGLPIVAGTTGTLSVARGGTGVTTSTGTGSVVLSTSPTLVTPVLGTPTSATLTNATGLPIVAGTTGTLSVARGGTGVTTSTGTGSVVLYDNPTFNRNITVGGSTTNPLNIGLNYNGTGINTVFGQNSLTALGGTSTSNMAIGSQVLFSGLTLNNCIGIGDTALALMSIGDGTIGIGMGAGLDMNVSSTAYSGVVVIGNNAIGGSSFGGVSLGGYAGDVGTYNTSIGYYASNGNTGNYNVSIGFQALATSLVGSSTTSDTVSIGANTLPNLTTGIRNTVIGSTSGATLSTGSNNILLGYNSQASSATDSNEIVIGSNATGLGANTTSIGNSSTTSATIYGSLQATGNGATSSNIYTAQTTGNLTIGGTGASGSITLGQSTGAQTVNIATASASTSIVNIGGATASTGAINIGRSTGTQTISIGSGATGSTVTSGATRTINIGSTSFGTGISNITIGKYSTSVSHTTYISGNTVTIQCQTLSLSVTGALSIGPNLVQSPVYVADLATLIGKVRGSRAFVLDATSPVFGSIVVDGGGTGTPVPVYYDGTDWRVG